MRVYDEMARPSKRLLSKETYDQPCPVNMKEHDWRHATDAPGWRIGDETVRCECCGQKGISP